jgi:uncharacterized protein YjbI with pentapeptide repeats
MANPEHIKLFLEGKKAWNNNQPVDADFSGHVFRENANFLGFIFNGEVSFFKATFNGGAYFSDTVFARHAIFNHTIFKCNAEFKRSAFKSAASFSKATFSQDADFISTKFTSYAGFENVEFNWINFNNAKFLGTTKFRKTTFLLAPKFHNAELHQDIDFTEAVFLDETNEHATSAYRTRVIRFSLI